MTRNQLLFQQNVETERSNRAREAETKRYNTVQANEVSRHNYATERETSRHNKKTEDIGKIQAGVGLVTGLGRTLAGVL